jgi:hypothetical protein
MKARSEESDREMTKSGWPFEEPANCFEDMVERMSVSNLVKKFAELGLIFTKGGPARITDKEHNLFIETGPFMENGDKVMIVSFLVASDIDDINHRLELMKKLRVYADLHQDRRGYRGAVAGVVFDDSVKNHALQNGLYVLEPSGETFTITEPQSRGYTPREW